MHEGLVLVGVVSSWINRYSLPYFYFCALQMENGRFEVWRTFFRGEVFDMFCIHPDWLMDYDPENAVEVAEVERLIEKWQESRKIERLLQTIWVDYLHELLGWSENEDW